MKQKIQDFVVERYCNQFPGEDDFCQARDEYEAIEAFAPNGNVFDSNENGISDKAHFVMRMVAQYHLTNAFKAMKIDLSDGNVSEDLETGNIGTPGRIIKVWTGFDTHDDMELGGGRWSKSPRLAKFDDDFVDERVVKGVPITKRVDLVSNCSHHFIPFHTKAREDSYAIISYIPDEFKLGISKLQRITDHVSQRFWLQEDLTDTLYKEVADAAKTDSVYVKLFNVVHGCESLRGAKSADGCFTSEAYGGKFKKKALRDQVLAK